MEQHINEAIEEGLIIKCQPWGEGQGDFVLVNASDFDPAFHKRLDDVVKPVAKKAAK